MQQMIGGTSLRLIRVMGPTFLEADSLCESESYIHGGESR